MLSSANTYTPAEEALLQYFRSRDVSGTFYPSLNEERNPEDIFFDKTIVVHPSIVRFSGCETDIIADSPYALHSLCKTLLPEKPSAAKLLGESFAFPDKASIAILEGAMESSITKQVQ